MNGKMQALEALLEMLGKMDLEKMKPQDGELKVEMELGDDSQLGMGEQPDQADEILRKQLGDQPEAPMGERDLSPEAEEAGMPSEDEEDLKKMYSKLS